MGNVLKGHCINCGSKTRKSRRFCCSFCKDRYKAEELKVQRELSASPFSDIGDPRWSKTFRQALEIVELKNLLSDSLDREALLRDKLDALRRKYQQVPGYQEVR